MSQVKGPMGRKVHRDSDSFADDKIGAQKAKKEQEKKAQKELGAKTRQAELCAPSGARARGYRGS